MEYAVKVGTAASFDAFLKNFPEAAAAVGSGVKVLAAPVEAPALDFSKRRCPPAAPSRPQGPKM